MNKTKPSVGGRIFLSYARLDDKDFVSELYERLNEEGFDVWWDMVDMPARGLTFLDEIRRSIQSVDRVLVVIGPDAIASEYVRAEWQYALAEGKVVIPLLRQGKMEDLPVELSPLNCLDHLEQRDPDIAFIELLEKLQDPVPEMGKLYGNVPDLPTRYQPRPHDFNKLAGLVLSDLKAPVEQVTAGQRVTVIHGIGGVGKSVLAATFARSTGTRRAFDHGVYWLTVGEPMQMLRRLAGLLKLSITLSVDAEILSSQVRDALNQRRILIILDDVAQLAALEPILRVLAVRTRLLVTSRNSELASVVGAGDVELRELAEKQALQLLADWAGADPEALPLEARQVAEFCAGLPLALALNGAVAASAPWSDVYEALQEADLSFAQRDVPFYDHPTVAASMQVSINALVRQNPTGLERYKELVVFHSDEGIPEQAVITLWAQTGGMKPRDGRELIVAFARSALVRLDGVAPTRRLVLHDLLQLQLRAMDAPMRPLHTALVDAYRKASPHGWASVKADGYIHDYLVEHLLEANQSTEAHLLCLDPAWFSAVERAIKTRGVDSFLDSLDKVILHARSTDELSILVQCCVVASRFAETAPPEIVGVFADAGQSGRAERLAGTIVFALDRCRAFSMLTERAETVELRYRFLTEAKRCLVSIDLVQRGMGMYWICHALKQGGDNVAAKALAREAWDCARQLELTELVRWNIPNAQFWAARAFRLVGDEKGLGEVREALEVNGRNLDLQCAAVCGDSENLKSFSQQALYPKNLVRRGNLALACAEAGLDEQCDVLLQSPCEGEPDAVRRFAWALALTGRFQDALKVIRGMDNFIEKAKAVRRVMAVAVSRDQTSEVTRLAELAEELAGATNEARDDEWRIQTHLASALSNAGRKDAACALAERVCERGIVQTEENTLVYPERLRQGFAVSEPDTEFFDSVILSDEQAAGSLIESASAPTEPPQFDIIKQIEQLNLLSNRSFKTGPRPLDTNVEALPDEVAAQHVIELSRAGKLDTARSELEQIRLPRARIMALMEIVRQQPVSDDLNLDWVDALICARSLGRNQLNEVLDSGRAWTDNALPEMIRKLDARWH